MGYEWGEKASSQWFPFCYISLSNQFNIIEMLCSSVTDDKFCHITLKRFSLVFLGAGHCWTLPDGVAQYILSMARSFEIGKTDFKGNSDIAVRV